MAKNPKPATDYRLPAADRSGVPMLRWVFRRDGRTLACEVDVRGAQSYEVAVVPLWDRSAAIVERFDRPLPALELHASIACELRNRGWAVVDHAIPRYVGIAA
jgi:hypothetical protein